MSSIRTWNHTGSQIGQLSNQLHQTDNTHPIDIGEERRLARVEPNFTRPKRSFFRYTRWKKGTYNENDRMDQRNTILKGIPTPSACVDDPRMTQTCSVDYEPEFMFQLLDTVEHSDVSSLSSSGSLSNSSECRNPPTPFNLTRPTMVTSEIPQRSLIAIPEPVSPISCPIERRIVEIEIHPGVYGRLRGAEETKQAVEDDFFLPCECFACQQTVFHIQDADFVLCPDCRTIQPVGESTFRNNNGGVGLGFKVAELLDIQQRIVRRRWNG